MMYLLFLKSQVDRVVTFNLAFFRMLYPIRSIRRSYLGCESDCGYFAQRLSEASKRGDTFDQRPNSGSIVSLI